MGTRERQEPSGRDAGARGHGRATRPHAGRARQEIDYGRRGKGYIFGAFQAATGEALTEPYLGRTTANFVDFLEKVEAWIPAEVERVYAILDNLSAHRATDVPLFSLAHPRWEFVFQPKYAAYLNLLEAWWKILRSLAFTGRRFETWADICQAVHAATAYWNAHRHPFILSGAGGDSVGDVPASPACPVSPPCPKWHELAGWTT